MIVGQRNGQLPLHLLAVVLAHHLLHPVAAARFLAMRAACVAATGVWIGITEAYRSFEQQDRIFRARYTPGHRSGIWYAGTYWRKLPWVPVAAVPGTSNHGWGLAVDINNYGHTNGVVFRWLLDHAGAYGFSWTTGRNVNEPWHWEYVGSLASWLTDTTPIPIELPIIELPEEEEMKTIQIHEVKADGNFGRRAILTPGTAYFVAWSLPEVESGKLANHFADEAVLNTGPSVGVNSLIFDHFQSRAAALEA